MKIFAAVLGICGATFLSIPSALAREPVVAGSFDHTHRAWADVLARYTVRTGPTSNVRYQALGKSRSVLQGYLRELEAVSKETFASFSRDQQLAFLINAYNALTVELILDHYPVKSIRDIGGLFSSPWKKKFFVLLGEKHSLDDMEHEMLRKRFEEPRIHFALVCASKGCPALRGEPFVATRLGSQLEEAAHLFLTDKGKNRYEPNSSTLYLSSIFKWYGDDFKKEYGSFKEFVSNRIVADTESQKRARSDRTKVEFLDYDWSLNDVPQNTQ